MYAIQTGTPEKQLTISDIDVSYENSRNGNPYNTTFQVNVVSGSFAGCAEFEYDIK